MSDKSGIENFIATVDVIRAAGFVVLLAAVGVGAIATGGTAGWMVGIGFLVADALAVTAWFRQRRADG